MEFTERMHAFISASFYRFLEEGGYPNFEAAFSFAARRYAEQRGERMAQRAIRDGRALDFASYRYYGEWAPTEDARQLGFKTPGKTFVWTEGEDRFLKHLVCPWSTQYLAMDMREAAELYCADLDVAIVRGFNPKLRYELCQTMHQREDFCLQVMRGGAGEDVDAPKDPENVRDFGYHCGHIFRTFRDVMRAVYGESGIRLGEQVLDAFGSAYGDSFREELVRQADRDFNYIFDGT